MKLKLKSKVFSEIYLCKYFIKKLDLSIIYATYLDKYLHTRFDNEEDKNKTY